MAKVILSGGVGQISGDVGAANFAQTKNGTVLRKKLNRVNHHSIRQTDQRSDFQRALSLYRSLTSAQRAAWSAAASLFTKRNRLAVQRKLSGFQFFMLNFTNPPEFFTPSVENPPLPRKTGIASDLRLVASSSPFSLLLYRTLPTVLFPRTFRIRTARVISDNPNAKVTNWRFTVAYSFAINPFPLTADFVDQWGAPAPGEFVAAGLLVWSVNWLPGEWANTSTIVT